MGGRLPAELHDWVRRDLTDPGWRARGLLRQLVQLTPFLVLFAALPGPTVAHVLAPLLLAFAGAFIGLALGDELRERRLRQHGLPSLRRRR